MRAPTEDGQENEGVAAAAAAALSALTLPALGEAPAEEAKPSAEAPAYDETAVEDADWYADYHGKDARPSMGP